MYIVIVRRFNGEAFSSSSMKTLADARAAALEAMSDPATAEVSIKPI